MTQGVAQAANISRAQHRPIVTFMMAKQYRPQFLISSIFMLYQQFDGARRCSCTVHFMTVQALEHGFQSSMPLHPPCCTGGVVAGSHLRLGAMQASTLSSSSHPSSSGAHHHAVLLCKVLDEQSITSEGQHHAVPAGSALRTLSSCCTPVMPSLRAQLSGRWQCGAAQHRHR